MQENSTINLKEIAKFKEYAQNWWNEESKQTAMLHKMNPFRLEYITNKLNVENLKVLDIGCGGGILAVPLARLKADVYGLEPVKELCEVAQKKAEIEGLKINFINSSIENYDEGNFDLILLMDILEHVENIEQFLNIAQSKLKTGGMIIISTINKTFLAKFLVKFMAEDILNIVEKGTHEPSKFVSPEKITNCLNEMKLEDKTGFFYNPILKKFYFTKYDGANYFICLKK